eukprot:Blabericola_migrator_1__961@NODE_123_length_13376_cov_72_514539_g109_i0_p8_GENE_NODE_123_length_13376_cov_72_514539_g109_i0NODE_123_length_13376_cov_72_514539_g109_i0_p8_ORF_typecomplete_len171_score7_49PolyA_pol/PF01743_20/1_9e06Aminoglyc_resit/PF10706_9/0_0099_NODE_123_length_13376_cov_72_514539_g109_i032683780
MSGEAVLRASPFGVALARFCSEADACPSSCSVWIAGGWARDVVLGMPPSDHDIVVEDCGGDIFATAFVDWWNSDQNRPIATVNVLERNEDAFRHVKIGKVHIKDLKVRVDFTGLRVSVKDLETLPTLELLKLGTSRRRYSHFAPYDCSPIPFCRRMSQRSHYQLFVLRHT